MVVHVQIVVAGAERPSVGSLLTVQVRDTALQDAPATLLGTTEGTVTGPSGTVGQVDVSTSFRGKYPTVYVHVDVDGDHKVSSGDWITTQSYPVPPGDHPTVTAVIQRMP